MRIRPAAFVMALTFLAGYGGFESVALIQTDQDASQPTGVRRLQVEASALEPLVESSVAKQFLNAVSSLPTVTPRTIYREAAGAPWMSAAQVAALPEEKRQSLQSRTLDEDGYYDTKYGTPLAYSRAIDLVGKRGLESLKGKKILDFGYGSIGQLRLMASCGAHAVGLDVDPFLTALYCEPTDQGVISINGESKGFVKLLSGRFSEADIREAVGDGYDLITAKNTLKRGYIHPPPEENVDKRMLVDLGLNDEEFVQIMYDILKPGGYFMIYNLCPKPAAPGEKYIPWADGRCPFDKSLLEKVGFQVMQFDADDTEHAHRMARALKWDDSMDVDNDLFGHYTLMQKPKQ